MIAAARWAAYQALRAVTEERADLPAALLRARGALDDERDRALVTRLVTGALQWLGALDHVVSALARRPVARLDPEVLAILRIGAYQLLHLERVPDSAVVNDAVDMTRRARKRSAAGLVNGVLRSVVRRRGALPLPARPLDPARNPEAALDYLSVTLSHPRWLAARWLNRYGFEAAERWMLFDNQPAPLTLRPNLARVSAEGLRQALADREVQTRPAAYAPEALVVTAGNPLSGPLAARGLFFVQDESSQLVGHFAAAHRGARVLDTCAAPGGKTLILADAVGPAGFVVSCDVRPARVELLRQTLATAGRGALPVVQMDLARGLPFQPMFDTVLVDAPCSGLGAIRRDPEIRWRRNEPELERFAALELQLLEQAADGVAPGGKLVYATCSSEPEENEDVMAAFLERRPDFQPLNPRAEDSLPAGVLRVLNDRGHLRPFPHVHGLEAFFGAGARRRRFP